MTEYTTKYRYFIEDGMDNVIKEFDTDDERTAWTNENCHQATKFNGHRETGWWLNSEPTKMVFFYEVEIY